MREFARAGQRPPLRAPHAWAVRTGDLPIRHRRSHRLRGRFLDARPGGRPFTTKRCLVFAT